MFIYNLIVVLNMQRDLQEIDIDPSDVEKAWLSNKQSQPTDILSGAPDNWQDWDEQIKSIQ